MSPVTAPGQAQRLGGGLAERQPFAGKHEPEPVRTVVEARRRVAGSDTRVAVPHHHHRSADGPPSRRDDGRRCRSAFTGRRRRSSTILSPARSPAAAAGEPCEISSTVRRGLPHRGHVGGPVKRTSARRMFASGPAAIAATRFHVGARQYALGAESVREILERLPCGGGRRRGELLLRDELLIEDGGGRPCAASWSRPRARASEPSDRAAERRVPPRRAPAREPGIDVGRSRTVHPRDLHEPTERDSAEPVLDAGCASVLRIAGGKPT